MACPPFEICLKGTPARRGGSNLFTEGSQNARQAKSRKISTPRPSLRSFAQTVSATGRLVPVVWDGTHRTDIEFSLDTEPFENSLFYWCRREFYDER